MIDGDRQLYFNGIQGATGDYLQPAMSCARFAAALGGRRAPPRVVKARAVEAGIDGRDLASAGWGVVFPEGCDPAVREALRPLLEHRRRQARRRDERFFRELVYLPGETKRRFLPRYGAGPGPVHPERVPYYLLLVGGPGEVPFDLQYGLDVQFAVGRLALPSPEDYARYAESVVAYEESSARSPRRAVFFGVENRGDPPTRISVEHLVTPLYRELRAAGTGWEFEALLRGDATRRHLVRRLRDDPPSFLFTAGHAVMFPAGHERQRGEQGALVCAEWPGPSWRAPLPPDHLFSAGDVPGDADLRGLVTFHFACFSAATPRYDAFSLNGRSTLAPEPFAARLPQRLLGHPRGGALAVVGHVDRAWEHSFLWDRAGTQVGVFASALRKILRGDPVGFAMEDFGTRYAELSTELHDLEAEAREGGPPGEDATGAESRRRELAADRVRLWTAFQDARGYVVLGDPAVRLRPEDLP